MNIADRIISIYQQDDYNNNPLVREEMTEKCRELRHLSNPDSEYSSVAKSYILGHSEKFIRNVATQIE
jgi:hypothetical protein